MPLSSPSPPPPGAPRFLGFPLTGASTRQFMEAILSAAAQRRARGPLTAGYLNAAQVNLAFGNAPFARDLAALDLRYADGQAIVWAARWRGVEVAERVNAGDFTMELMQSLAARGLRLALVGGRPAADAPPPPAIPPAGPPPAAAQSEAERAAARFTAWAPGLQIVFCHHGYFPPEQAGGVFAALEASAPDLVLLGMGAPRQERQALEWAAQGEPRVYWCVGALFEYYCGARPRAPRWMRRCGLEWLVRLILEPRRLGRRYLLGNPLFVARALRGRPPRGINP